VRKIERGTLSTVRQPKKGEIMDKNKLAMVLSALGLASASAASVASADPNPLKDLCKNGGWQALGFSNHGGCVSALNHGFVPGGGSGGAL
jgi:hypothetical protein